MIKVIIFSFILLGIAFLGLAFRVTLCTWREVSTDIHREEQTNAGTGYYLRETR